MNEVGFDTKPIPNIRKGGYVDLDFRYFMAVLSGDFVVSPGSFTKAAAKDDEEENN